MAFRRLKRWLERLRRFLRRERRQVTTAAIIDARDKSATPEQQSVLQEEVASDGLQAEAACEAPREQSDFPLSGSSSDPVIARLQSVSFNK